MTYFTFSLHSQKYVDLRLFSLVMLLMVSLSLSAQTQRYKSSIGLKFGYPNTVAYKTFLGHSANAVEISLGAKRYSSYRGWVGISAAYLVHKDFDDLFSDLDLPESEHVSVYFGGGVGTYLWNYRYDSDRDYYGSTSLAIQGYVGSEYRFEDIPLVIGLEYAPSVSLRNTYYGRLGWGYGTLSIRYVLK